VQEGKTLEGDTLANLYLYPDCSNGSPVSRLDDDLHCSTPDSKEKYLEPNYRGL
jgi:hypothetical protein